MVCYQTVSNGSVVSDRISPLTSYVSSTLGTPLLHTEVGCPTILSRCPNSGVNASSKLGGRSAEGLGCGEGVFSSPSGERASFGFCDLKMAYFGEF